MDILTCQASSVPSERVFSSAKETQPPRRNKIGTDTMEACQMLKYSYKSSGAEIDFTSHHSTQRILEEMEDADNYRLSVPEDVSEYYDMMNM